MIDHIVAHSHLKSRTWWMKLGTAERNNVLVWIRRNPPPDYFEGTLLDWAHLEMPVWQVSQGLFKRLLDWLESL